MKKSIFFAVYTAAAVFQAAAQQPKPAWVDRPSVQYPEDRYVAAVGSGQDRQGAENNAKAALSAYFRQSVSNTISIVDTERQVDGRSQSASAMAQSIQAHSSLENLMGAEIRDQWNDAGLWYALVLMDKPKCAPLYDAGLSGTLAQINGLIDSPEGPSFETIIKCEKARRFIPKAETEALILYLLGGANRSPEVFLSAAAVARAAEEARFLSVNLRVQGDRNSRITAAFAEALTQAGLKTGDSDSRYTLEAAVIIEPGTVGRYFSAAYTVTAVLKDNRTNAGLFSYSASDTERHPAGSADAENRALLAAVQSVTDEFPQVLREYFAGD